MGADGHIGIYDLPKLEEKFGRIQTDLFLEQFLSSVFYRQELNGKSYLTRYWGDNIQDVDSYEVVYNSYSAIDGKFNEKSYSYSEWEVTEFKKLKKADRNIFANMIQYLEKECQITSWEVWT
jgi:hypothetical protein